MKKVYLIVLLAFMSIVSMMAQSELRKKVAIVRPVYYDSSVKFLNDFSDMLRRDGYINAADLLKEYAKGGFGSGFVFKDPTTGKLYVVTNRHVVAMAKSVTIEFQGSDRVVSSYTECPVIAVDNNLDLAIVQLPDNLQLPSFSFASAPVSDGQEVFTAGYPGLGDKPSWQLGNGIVSNAAFYEEELTKSDTLSLIQHTAQIDAGSSGSPLLVRNKAVENDYLVVGLNTWKAVARENANFAIPASEIERFCNSLNSITKPDKNSLKRRADDMLKAAQKDYKDVLPFIAYEYLSEVTPRNFEDWYNSAPKEVRDEILKQFDQSNPVEGVRMALAYTIARQINKKNTKIKSVGNTTDGVTTVSMTYDDKPATSLWVVEQGQWRISKMSFVKLTEIVENGIIKNFYRHNSVIYSRTTNLGGAVPFSFSNISYTAYNSYFSLGISVGSGKMDNFAGISLDYSIGAVVPIAIERFRLLPYAKPFGGFALFSDSEEPIKGLFGLRTGVDVAYKLGRKFYCLAGLGYEFKKIGPTKLNNIAINIGVMF